MPYGVNKKKSNVIRLEIQDRKDPSAWTTIDRWTEYSIKQSVFAPADDFTVHPTPDLRGKFLSGEQLVKIHCGDDLRFSGVTDEKASDSNEKEPTLAISGRDHARWLLDCSSEPTSIYNKTLVKLAEVQCNPWLGKEIAGITTDNAPNFYRLYGKPRRTKKVKRDVYGTDGALIGTWTDKKLIPGISGAKSSPYYRGVDQDRVRETWTGGDSSRWDVLQQHADRVASAMWFTCDAYLFIGRPRYNEYAHDPGLVYKLNGSGNVLKTRFTPTTSDRFSNYTFFAQGRGGRPDKGLAVINHKVQTVDPGGAFYKDVNGTLTRRSYKPTTISVKKGIQDTKLLRRLARGQMEMRAVQAYKYQVDVEGHRWSDGSMWAADCMVDVIDEYHGIKGPHYITGVDLKQDEDTGVHTTLHLIPGGIWLALDHDDLSDKDYQDIMRWRIWW